MEQSIIVFNMKLFLVVVAVLVPAVVVVLVVLAAQDRLLPVPPLPSVPDVWWGRGAPPNHPLPGDTAINHFRLNVSQSELQDLNARLSSDLSRLAPPLEDVAFEFGINTDSLAEIGKYWRSQYDWKQEEANLNSIPQFTTSISGLTIHFIHVKPDVKPGQVMVPLLLVHGWPGSVVEFLRLLPLLTSPSSDIVFSVVAPSIPGYGFSSAPARPGFSAVEAARVFRDLMVRLGYSQFYCQGGDWGSIITTTLATLYPGHVTGLHTNMPVAATPGSTIKQLLAAVPPLARLLVDSEDLPKLGRWSSLLRETGYLHLQATKPDTLGVALSSSPLGLAGYILEKFSTWTDPSWMHVPGGGLDKHPAGMDALITNVMFYWISNSITSSLRFYAENLPGDVRLLPLSRIPVSVPVGVADFPHELFPMPRAFLTGKYPEIIQYTRMNTGGHFAAMEIPEILAEDIRNFIRKVENKTINGKQEL